MINEGDVGVYLHSIGEDQQWQMHAEGTETQDGLVYCRWPLAQKMSSKPIEIIITIIDYYINQSINGNNMKINQ